VKVSTVTARTAIVVFHEKNRCGRSRWNSYQTTVLILFLSDTTVWQAGILACEWPPLRGGVPYFGASAGLAAGGAGAGAAGAEGAGDAESVAVGFSTCVGAGLGSPRRPWVHSLM
jgi:hypothetical protein